jgi:hypothetical protein
VVILEKTWAAQESGCPACGDGDACVAAGRAELAAAAVAGASRAGQNQRKNAAEQSAGYLVPDHATDFLRERCRSRTLSLGPA